MINGKEDAANSRWGGHDMIGKAITNLILDRIQKIPHQCTGIF
jgi:hypothetical protein